jgi:hypothetical protein
MDSIKLKNLAECQLLNFNRQRGAANAIDPAAIRRLANDVANTMAGGYNDAKVQLYRDAYPYGPNKMGFVASEMTKKLANALAEQRGIKPDDTGVRTVTVRDRAFMSAHYARLILKWKGKTLQNFFNKESEKIGIPSREIELAYHLIGPKPSRR